MRVGDSEEALRLPDAQRQRTCEMAIADVERAAECQSVIEGADGERWQCPESRGEAEEPSPLGNRGKIGSDSCHGNRAGVLGNERVAQQETDHHGEARVEVILLEAKCQREGAEAEHGGELMAEEQARKWTRDRAEAVCQGESCAPASTHAHPSE